MSADVGVRLAIGRGYPTPLSRQDPAAPGMRAAFASVDEMLSPEVLEPLIGRPVDAVRRAPFTPAGDSSTGAAFEAIHLDGVATPSFITKTVDRGADWVAIATSDRVDREVRVWEAGLLDRVPAPATHAVIAGARTATGYTVLMNDLSSHLLPGEDDGSPSPTQQRLVVESLAALHAEFWLDESLSDTYLGLSSLSEFVGHLSPSTMGRVRMRLGGGLPDWVDEGWAVLPTLTDPHLAEDLRAIADDPSLVVEAAGGYPWTLAHTDPRPANVAVDSEAGRAYFLDWTRPALALPAIDLLYWAFNANRAERNPRDDLITAYVDKLRQHLRTRFSSGWWEPQLDLAFVAFVACFAPIIANVSPQAVRGWTERCRPGLRALR